MIEEESSIKENEYEYVVDEEINEIDLNDIQSIPKNTQYKEEDQEYLQEDYNIQKEVINDNLQNQNNFMDFSMIKYINSVGDGNKILIDIFPKFNKNSFIIFPSSIDILKPKRIGKNSTKKENSIEFHRKSEITREEIFTLDKNKTKQPVNSQKLMLNNTNNKVRKIKLKYHLDKNVYDTYII